MSKEAQAETVRGWIDAKESLLEKEERHLIRLLNQEEHFDEVSIRRCEMRRTRLQRDIAGFKEELDDLVGEVRS